MNDKQALMNERRRLLRTMSVGASAAVAYGALGRAANVFAADVSNKAFAVSFFDDIIPSHM